MTIKLFSPFQLRGLSLPNRIVVSPMCQYSAVDGVVQPWHLMHLGGLAKANPGLVIMEATAVSAAGRISSTCTGLWNAAQEAAMSAMVAAIRSFSSTPLGIQLAHAGPKASTQKLWTDPKATGPLTAEEGAWSVFGPSPIPFDTGWPQPQALDAGSMAQIKAEWVEATYRADRCGFDLIEIHGAHGYLLSSFFSPLLNRRKDAYGGDIDGRMRFPLEVVEAMRAAWPADKPLGIRINGSDWAEDGSTVEDAVIFTEALRAVGADYVTPSAGNTSPNMRIPELKPGYMAHFAAHIRAATGFTTMAVGLIVEPFFAERLLQQGTADLVAVARGILDDPNWPYHAAVALGALHTQERCYQSADARRWPGYAIAHGNDGAS